MPPGSNPDSDVCLWFCCYDVLVTDTPLILDEVRSSSGVLQKD